MKTSGKQIKRDVWDETQVEKTFWGCVESFVASSEDYVTPERFMIFLSGFFCGANLEKISLEDLHDYALNHLRELREASLAQGKEYDFYGKAEELIKKVLGRGTELDKDLGEINRNTVSDFIEADLKRL